MYTYRLNASPAAPYWHWNISGIASLTPGSLIQTLAGVVVHRMALSPDGGYDLEIQLDRASHQDALAEIDVALGQLGLDAAQVLITQWATSVVEGALFGGAGGGAIGSAAKDPIAIAAGIVIGALVGAAVGSLNHKVLATYQASRQHPYGGGWHITPLSQSDAQSGTQSWWPA